MPLLPVTLQHRVRRGGLQRKPLPQPSCWRAAAPCWYLVLKDLIGHQLLQQVPVDSVAGLRPAARGGPLKREEA